MKLLTPEMPNYEILKGPAKPVEFPLNESIKQIISQMRDFIESLASPYGKPAGLAAPQVGYPYQIVLIQVPPEAKKIRRDVFDIWPLTVLLNPSYSVKPETAQVKDWEGCYSVPDKMGEVRRFYEIEYQAFLENGEKISGTARGFLARVIQHEVAHLEGKLYVDLLTQDCRFGTQTEMWPIRQAELTSF